MPGSASAIVDDKLTVKQARFVKAYIENDCNGRSAALEAYDTDDPGSAASIASENLNKINVRQAILAALPEAQISAGYLARKLREGLESTRYTLTGKQCYDEVPDNNARLKALDTAFRLVGAYAPTLSESKRAQVSVHITEPILVRRFLAQHGRLPTAEERKQLSTSDNK